MSARLLPSGKRPASILLVNVPRIRWMQSRPPDRTPPSTCNHEQTAGRGDDAGYLSHDISELLRGGKAFADGQTYGHGWIQMAA